MPAFVFWTYIAAIALAPLPFGGVHTLFQAFFSTIIFTLSALWSVQQSFFPEKRGLGIGCIGVEVLCFAVVCLWIGMQMVPGIPWISDNPLWLETQTVLDAPTQGSFALARGAAFESLLRLTTYAAVFWLALQFGRDRHRAHLLLTAVVVFGTVYAVYGLVIHLGGFEQVLWVEHRGTRQSLSSTLINRNNYATLAGLCLLCGVGLYQARLQHQAASTRTGRDRIVFVLHDAFTKGVPMLAGICILLTALLLTHSRAGVSAGLIGLFFLMNLSRIARTRTSWMSRLVALGLPIGLIAVYLLSGELWQDRLLGTQLEEEGRFVLYSQLWEAVQRAPWGGYGAGSFAQLFPMSANELTSHWDKAHNDWLEMVFDLGWPVALLWFAILLSLGGRCLLGVFRRRRDRLYPMVGCSACVLVGLHSFVDFSLQIPAVSILFAMLLGVGVGQSWSSRRESSHDAIQ